MRRRPALAGLAVALAAAIAGCAEDRGILHPPAGGPFSPQTTAASIHSLRFAPDNVAVVQVRTISAALGLTSSFQQAAARPERRVTPRGSLAPAFAPAAIRAAVANRTARLAEGSAVPLFPINFLGATFVYDAGLEAYVLDSSLDGAPQNGVRFLLYTLDPVSRLPALPLFPIGFVDLIDQSDAVSTRLRVRAIDTAGGTSAVLADYLVDGAFGSLSTGVQVSLLSRGFIADRNGRFDFDLDELLETDDEFGVTLISLRHEVITAEGTRVNLETDGQVANDGSFSDLFFGFDIHGVGGDTRVELDVVDEFQDGTIAHDGALEVIVSGTISQPTFVRPQGGGFTLSELEALDEMLFGIDDVLILADELYAPLGELFGVR